MVSVLNYVWGIELYILGYAFSFRQHHPVRGVPRGKCTFQSRMNGTNLSLVCKAVALFLKSLLLYQVQPQKLTLLTLLFIQKINNLLLLLFNLSEIFTSWAQSAYTELKLLLLFLW